MAALENWHGEVGKLCQDLAQALYDASYASKSIGNNTVYINDLFLLILLLLLLLALPL